MTNTTKTTNITNITNSDIDSILKTQTYHVFHNGKLIKQLSTPFPKKLNELVKEYINPPETDKKVFVIRIKFNPNEKKSKLVITCLQQTIKKNLNIATDKRDYKITVRYSDEELNKYGFKLIHIKKIIKTLKNITNPNSNFDTNAFSLDKNIVNIEKIFDVVK